MNRVLVAGMDTEINPFTKMVLDYGFKPAHVDRLSNKELPDCGAAIVAISNCGHSLAERVRKEYKDQGKPVLFSKTTGISGIKEEFERILVNPIREQLEDMTWTSKLYYLLCIYYKPGSKFIFKVFHQQVMNYLPDCRASNISNFLKKGTQEETITKIKGSKGRYIFEGINEEVASSLQAYGIQPQTGWYKAFQGQEIDQPMQPPKDLSPSEVERLQQEIQNKNLSNSEEMNVLLDMVRSLNDSVETIKNSTTVKIAELNKKVSALQVSFDPKGSDVIIDEITSDLRKLSMADLRRFQAMMMFWMNKRD